MIRRSLSALLLVVAAACATSRPPIVQPTPPPVVSQPAILTVKVDPAVAVVRVGDQAWATRSDGTVEEEFRGFSAGDTILVEVAARGYVSRTVTAILMPGRMAPVYVALQRIPNTAIVNWARAFCPSYYQSITDPDLDLELFGAQLQSVKGTCTRTWLIDAWSLGERDGAGKFLPGQYDGFIPVVRLPDGRFDLSRWNDAYFERIRRYVETMNAYGIFPHLTVLELYAWSQEKSVNEKVPDVNRQPYRNNINGIRWGGPDGGDDRTFGAIPENNPDQLPDWWLKAFIAKVVDVLQGTVYALEIGNEMKEKPMHWRILDAIRASGFTGSVTCSRNEDTPGQPWNMDRCDAIALHNKLTIDYLDMEYPREASAGRPTTFRAMWPLVDPARIIISSDGGGGKPEFRESFREVACDAFRRGAAVEVQLEMKRERFFRSGALKQAESFEGDRPTLLAMAACRAQ